MNIEVLEDDIVEGSEAFTVTLSGEQGAPVAQREATVTIRDNDTVAGLSIGDTTVQEAAGNADFTVALSKASAQEVRVAYATVEGTATAGLDYAAASDVLTFAPGETEGVISVAVLDDNLDEGNETFFISLGTAEGATVVDGSGQGTILDDEGAPSLSLEDLTVREAAGVASVRLGVRPASGQAIAVGWVLEDGTALSGQDFDGTSGTESIAAGSSEAFIDVPIHIDGLVEPDETFVVRLTEIPEGVEAGRDSAIVTIVDDDKPVIGIGDITVLEHAVAAQFSVTMDQPAYGPVTVNYASVDGTATGGEDYRPVAGILAIAAGELSAVISVPVIDDNRVEGPEVFTMILSGVVGATIDDGEGEATIQDNDEFNLSIQDVETDEDGGAAEFTVSLDVRNTAQVVSVDYATADGTATAGLDYNARTGTLVIPAGAPWGTILVPVRDDGLHEGPETFTVTLSGAVHANIARQTATATIVDNDLRGLGIEDSRAVENAGALTFGVRLDGASHGPVTFRYELVDATALSGSDYVAGGGSLMFLPGEMSKTIEVELIDDEIDEPEESLKLVVVEVESAFTLNAEATGRIVDDDPEPELAVSDATASEGDGEAVFAVMLGRESGWEVSVDYETVEQSAEEGRDYERVHGTLTIPAGETMGEIRVPVLEDTIAESDETFLLRLSNAQNASLARVEAVGTILGNSTRPVLHIDDVRVPESGGSAVFTVRLSGQSTEQVEVSYATADETAEAGEDYEGQRDKLILEAGAVEATITVLVLDDALDEADEETFVVRLNSAVHADIGDREGRGTILDDDPEPELAVSDATASEGDGEAVFAVMLGRESGWEVSVDYETVEQSAEEGRDYERVHGTLTIPAGETMGEIRVPVLEDTIAESDETFLLRLSNAQNASLARVEAVGTILGNSTRPVLHIDDVRVPESGGSAVFTVRLSGQSTEQVEVSYATADETAEAGEDYEGQRDKLILEAGAVEATITVPVLDDALDEADEETFVVRLNSAVHADIGDREGRGTIVDDDADLTLSINDIQVSEDARVAAFSVTLSRRSSEVVTVQFETSDASAAAPPDYTASRGIAVFEPGSSTGSVQVVIVDDALDEEEETFQVSLSNATNARIAKGVGVGTILDNDSMPRLRIDDIVVSEYGGSALFRVHLSGPEGRLVTVRYRTVDGTAQAGLDYEARAGVLVFAPGSVEEFVVVPLLRDGRDWREETFFVMLESADHARIEDAVAVATIVEEESVLEGVLGEYVARFTRAAAGHVVEAVDERQRWLDSAPRCMPLVGQGLDMAGLRQVNASWDPSAGEILSGCALSVTTETEGGAFSLWGRGAFTRYSGRDGALALQGNVATATLGVDYHWHRGFMAGLLLARDQGTGTFTVLEQEGEASSTQTGVYPYVRYGLGSSAVWALAGYGVGTAEVASAASVEASLRSRLAAAGARGRLLTGVVGRLSYRADALLVRTTADALEIQVSRLRVGLEAVLTTSRIMSPYVEAGLRRDGGDAETGYGLELGGGMRLAYPGRKLRAEFSSRGLMSHAVAGFTEWGVAGSVQYGAREGWDRRRKSVRRGAEPASGDSRHYGAMTR